ncbi:MAG: FkbM family methyltransferase [Candidatus Babeliales bacterium]
MVGLPVSGVKEYAGFYWPDYDVHCGPAVIKHVGDLEEALSLVGNFDTAIQAGGNCGVFPVHLAQHFDMVYTFEPHPDNFYCLNLNTQGIDNIVKSQMALGNGKILGMGIHHVNDNAGAHYMIPDGDVTMIAIDSLNLDNVGLIQLDIEGGELGALQGAENTIKKCWPVIMVEEKGHGQKYYNIEIGAVEKYLFEMGYKRVKKINRDYIFIKE